MRRAHYLDHSMSKSVGSRCELIRDGRVHVGVIAAVDSHGASEGRAEDLGQVLTIANGLDLRANDFSRLLEESVAIPVRIESLKDRGDTKHINCLATVGACTLTGYAPE